MAPSAAAHRRSFWSLVRASPKASGTGAPGRAGCGMTLLGGFAWVVSSGMMGNPCRIHTGVLGHNLFFYERDYIIRG